MYLLTCFFFFFFNDTATTEIYTLSLHDALPICVSTRSGRAWPRRARRPRGASAPLARSRRRTHTEPGPSPDRKSTRLNSSHLVISYAVFCLKKKKNLQRRPSRPLGQHSLCPHGQ